MGERDNMGAAAQGEKSVLGMGEKPAAPKGAVPRIALKRKNARRRRKAAAQNFPEALLRAPCPQERLAPLNIRRNLLGCDKGAHRRLINRRDRLRIHAKRMTFGKGDSGHQPIAMSDAHRKIASLCADHDRLTKHTRANVNLLRWKVGPQRAQSALRRNSSLNERPARRR